jgi:hypothetical protein
MERQGHEQAVIKAKSARVVDRMKISCLVSCLGAWDINVREQLALKTKSQKITYRLKYSCLANTCIFWNDNVQEQMVSRSKSERIAHRLRSSCIVNGYETWRDRAKEQVTTKAKSARIVHRMKDSCFEVWGMNVRESARNPYQMKSSCTFDFLVWREIVLKQMDLKTRSGSEDIDIKKLSLTFFNKIMHRLTVRLQVEYLDR